MSAVADTDKKEAQSMYSPMADPHVASTLARQRIEERIREADARRTAREVRRTARSQHQPLRPRITWVIPTFRRAFAS